MKIAIIGGSITEGAGASKYKNSYVYKFEQYFNEKYKHSVIKNLGAGGTASQFGLFRLKRDLNDFKPDLIFIEFAVNDRIYSVDDIGIYFEGLIRECCKITNKIIIIDFPTGMADSYTSIHKKFAYFYNIPVIDVQDEIFKIIGNQEITWSKISIDNLHPNDIGHNIYFKIIKDNVEKINLEELDVKLNNKVLSKYNFRNPKIKSYEECTFYGHWEEKEVSLNNKFKFGAKTNTIGDCMEVNFKGNYLAMMCILSNKSGILECILDDKFTFTLDLYMDNDACFSTLINLKDIGNGEHSLLIKLSQNKNEKSLGNEVIIGGFLVDED
ncbi:SGNH/GDSL hydrolase family protein [uncultured Clostridium sp.]|uniref:SGNH/GDSL hydrolase family protein n=1 Tax=uncultured Clostridium sp. TaxID=59620 RepID=UPI0028F05881|nr:SGNH/GDSL hydrolase family protein [uncultured Clostridium sp.]